MSRKIKDVLYIVRIKSCARKINGEDLKGFVFN